jgi:hypothetical protein
MNIAAKSIQLRDNGWGLHPASRLCGKLRTAVQRVGTFASLNFGERVSHFVTFGFGKPGNRVVLGFKS